MYDKLYADELGGKVNRGKKLVEDYGTKKEWEFTLAKRCEELERENKKLKSVVAFNEGTISYLKRQLNNISTDNAVDSLERLLLDKYYYLNTTIDYKNGSYVLTSTPKVMFHIDETTDADVIKKLKTKIKR